MSIFRWVVLVLCLGNAHAAPMEIDLKGQALVAFSPGDDAGALVVDAIRSARRQVLVQAYSFTHRAIADALVTAVKRGVDVRVIADPVQHDRIATSLIDELASQGVPVYLDGQHGAANNKVMVIDAGQPESTVITGSFNFTQAAQYRNAENLLILRGVPALAEAYADDWRRHKVHALPFRK